MYQSESNINSRLRVLVNPDIKNKFWSYSLAFIFAQTKPDY